MQDVNTKNVRLWARLGQRGTICGIALPEIMSDLNNCYVLTADLGHTSGLDRVMEQYPNRFINLGIAEQNLIGVASGLAFDNNISITTTFSTFLTMRCYEQIRHNLGYQKANVKLLGGAAGYTMGMFGNTHYAFEDLAIMRVIPNMVVVSPADAVEAYYAIYAAVAMPGPIYIRMSDGVNSHVVNKEPYEFVIGKSVCLQEGKDILMIATGGVVYDALAAAKKLEEYGLRPSVFNMHTIKPLDKEMLEKYSNWGMVVTIEEHSVIGGLGSAVAEFYATKEKHPRQILIGVEDRFVSPGEQDYVKRENGLDAAGIAERILKELR